MAGERAYEKLGAFYLGREQDADTGETTDRALLYDAKDLTTHAFCVGMTGSGKTGLCVSLLEEAAIDGIPALAIDPKGDLGNLLLTFPDLAPADFRPWIDEGEAARKGVGPDVFAAQQADLWKEGLAGWDQDGARIRRLRDSADFAIYTPGSEAGLPVSILDSFAAPPAAVLADGDLLRDRVGSTATGLLGLLGIDADPIRSREHILLSTILHDAWRRGESLDLGALISRIQHPGVDRIGVMETDSFFPPKERFELSMRLNNLLAAPGFAAWLSGAPLDVQQLLYTPEGKPRIAIFSIAHLPETERMFFVSLLLNQLLSWMRTRPGTNSLRALLYMDEIAGYLPPVAEPPSKKPMLTLLKQARAFGVGVVLATQNPVDLDYKGLSNTGTWFLGRLQTERDKERVLAGLEGVSTGPGGFDRQAMERTLAGLGKRVFLMHNVHEDRPVLFQTRWAMSYLRGPLTREQIRTLTAQRKAVASAGLDPAAPAAGPAAATPAAVPAPASGASEGVAVAATPPLLSPAVPQGFVAARGAAGPAGVRYAPWLVGFYRVQYVDRKTKRTLSTDDGALRLPLSEGSPAPDWERAEPADIYPEDLLERPDAAEAFAPLLSDAGNGNSYRGWAKELSDVLYRTRSLELFESPTLGQTSNPDETEQSFRIRLAEAAREQRDALTDELRKKYAARQARLDERLRRAQQKLEREAEQASGQKMQAAISIGATLLSAFLGRKAVSRTTVGKATTALRGAGRAHAQAQDVDRAQEDIEAIRQQMTELSAELEAEIDALADRIDPLTEELATESVRPRRSDVDVRGVRLVWLPASPEAG